MPLTTQDTLLNGKVKLQQPAKGYRAAIDPVLLAAAIPAVAGEAVLELGCGAGAVMLCLAARVSGLKITGVELAENALACAKANIARQSALADFTAMHGDVRRRPPDLPAEAFDHIAANPPYHDDAGYDAGPEDGKTAAHAMSPDDLALWVKTAQRHVKHRGSFTVIYRADGLDVLLAAMGASFGGLTILPLWPKSGVAAKRVIVQGRKDSKAPLRLLPGLTLHKADGGYTADADAVLRDAGGIDIT